MLIGTAGHIDHGKTSLVKALTGVDTDRLKEEKARGITIELGYAYQPVTEDQTLGFIDVPGHEKLVHTMLAGATGIDFVLLVVAADDGIMPQTREHVAIAELLGIARGAVAITKIDRVDDARAAEVRAAVSALLSGTALRDAPAFAVSAATGRGIEALRAHLHAEAAARCVTVPRGYFRLAIDRVFTLAGAGTVVTGTVVSGTVRAGEAVTVSPGGIEARVRGLHAQNRPAEAGFAGQRCALNLAGERVSKQALHRGDWVLAPRLHAPSARLAVELRLVAQEARALRHWTPVHFHLGAADVGARVSLLEGDALTPGATALAELVLDRPVSAVHGDRFIVRDQSASRTLGGGRVIDPFPLARGKRRATRTANLKALALPDHGAALAALLEGDGAPVELERFALARNLAGEELRAALTGVAARIVDGPPAMAVSMGGWQQLAETTLARLAAEHERSPDMPGVDRERLRRMVGAPLPPALFRAMTDELLATQRVLANGPWLSLPGHRVHFGAEEERLWARIAPLLATERLQPPRVRDLARALQIEEAKVRTVLKHAARIGHVYPVAHDHYFLKSAVDELVGIARELAAQGGGVHVIPFRDRIQTGRKLAIHILEFFDRVGVTRRVGDLHRLRSGSSLIEGTTAPRLN